MNEKKCDCYEVCGKYAEIKVNFENESIVNQYLCEKCFEILQSKLKKLFEDYLQSQRNKKLEGQ